MKFDEKSALDGKSYESAYFERAVFESTAENKVPYDVLISKLGTLRYSERASPPVKAASGVYVNGISAGPQHYPLLAGPHAAAGLNAWIYDNDPAPVVGWVKELGVKWVMHQLSGITLSRKRVSTIGPCSITP